MELWQRSFYIYLIQVFISSVYCRGTNIANIDWTEAYTTCSEGWFTFGDKCYKVGRRDNGEAMNWWNSKNFCAKEGGVLATVYSQEIQDFLTAFLLVPEKSSLWIGLNDEYEEGKYKWADGTPLEYKNYEPFEPSSDYIQFEDCTEMVYQPMNKKSYQEMGQWNDVFCNRYFPYLCQKEKGTDVVLDPGYCKTAKGFGRRFEESCYQLVQEEKNWTEAEEHCVREFNGHLASFDYRSNYFINYIFRDFLKAKDVWLGIKIKEETQQRWSSGWLVTFENWGKQLSYADGMCVSRKYHRSWNLRDCDEKLWFLCEHSTSKETPPVLTPTVENTHCPPLPIGSEGWRDFGGDYCYYLDLEKKITFREARLKCKKRGGTLASFHSQVEMDILHQFVQYYDSSPLYIGLKRKKGKDFYWVDGSEMTFTSWSSGHPNNNTWEKNKKCGEMTVPEMKWKQVDCSDEKGFICSTRKVAAPPIVKAEIPLKKLKEGVKDAASNMTLRDIAFNVINQMPTYIRSMRTESDKGLV